MLYLFQNLKTHLAEGETVARKHILLIRITNKETTEKLNEFLLHKETGSTLQRK